jgi:hypothetical protein
MSNKVKEKNHRIESRNISISPIDPRFQYQCLDCGRLATDINKISSTPCR